MHKCLPDDFRVTTIELRTSIPLFINLRFIKLLIGNLRFLITQRPGRLGHVLVYSILEFISPKIIISCGDNDPLLAGFAMAHPNIPVVLIQNAMRDTKDSFNALHRLPIYLAFGEIEALILKKLNLRYQAYHSVGSVKLGLALKKWKQSTPTVYDVAFISHYRPEMFGDNGSSIQARIEHCQRRLFVTTVEYVQTNKLDIVVLLKTREQKLQNEEKHYYSQLAGKLPIRFIVADKAEREFDTYIAGLSSSLVIHPGSTLGFELFAAGKKVIFGASIDPELIDMWGVQPYFDILPSAVKLPADCKQDDFFEICNDLASYEEQDYLLMSKDAANLIISMPEAMRPDQAIRKFVSSML